MQKKCLVLDSLELSTEVGQNCFAVFRGFFGSCLLKILVSILLIVHVVIAVYVAAVSRSHGLSIHVQCTSGVVLLLLLLFFWSRSQILKCVEAKFCCWHTHLN